MDKYHIRLNTFAISLFLGTIFLLTPLLFFSSCPRYYQLRFEEYGVYDEFESNFISEEKVNHQINNLILHLSPLTVNLDVDFYSKEDVLHLYDVKNIITFLYFVYILSIAYVLWFFKYKKSDINFKLLKKQSQLYILAILVTGLITFFNFDYLFTFAHDVTFSNDYWLLDPNSSNLINFFPQSLFLEIFMIVIISNLLMHISFIMLTEKFYGKRKTK